MLGKRTTVALALTVAMAGLGLATLGTSQTSPPATVGSPETTEAPTELPWELLDCTYVYAQVPVAWSKLQPHMPEGFEPAPPVLLRQLTQAPEGTSLLSFEIDVCEQGTGLNGLVDDMVYASIWVATFPPDHVEVPDVAGTFVNWDVLVPDQDRRQVLQDAGLPAHDGGVQVSWGQTPTPLNTVSVAYELEGLGSFAMELQALQDPRVFESSFAQWTEAEDGRLARWTVDWSQQAAFQGTGTLELAPGTWVADVVGAETVPVRALAGHWSYTDGQILLPGHAG